MDQVDKRMTLRQLQTMSSVERMSGPATKPGPGGGRVQFGWNVFIVATGQQTMCCMSGHLEFRSASAAISMLRLWSEMDELFEID